MMTLMRRARPQRSENSPAMGCETAPIASTADPANPPFCVATARLPPLAGGPPAGTEPPPPLGPGDAGDATRLEGHRRDGGGQEWADGREGEGGAPPPARVGPGGQEERDRRSQGEGGDVAAHGEAPA